MTVQRLGLPPRIERSVEDVRAATQRLLRAAQAGSPEAIEEAIELRGGAVDRLQALFRREGRGVSAEARLQIVELLSLQAADAESDLRDFQIRIRDELRSLANGSRALEGYARRRNDPSSLDRSG